MGIKWRDSYEGRVHRSKGPMKTKSLTRLFIVGKKGETRIVDSVYNEYTLEQVKELINSGVAFTEDPLLIELLGEAR